MPAYRVSKLARADLLAIAAYTQGKWGLTQAKAYIKAVEEAFWALAANPKLGRPTRGSRIGIRRMEHASHVVFYQVFQNENILIARVLHKRMLPENYGL